MNQRAALERRLAGVVLLGLLGSGCGKVEVMGGAIVPRGQEPAGLVVASYRTEGCSDADGGFVRGRQSGVFLVQTDASSLKLVDTLRGYDSWVVSNTFDAHGERVFQLSTTGAEEGAVLLDYRFPLKARTGKDDRSSLQKASIDFDRPARMAWVTTWQEDRRDDQLFRAYFRRPALVCRLVRGDGKREVPAARANYPSSTEKGVTK